MKKLILSQLLLMLIWFVSCEQANTEEKEQEESEQQSAATDSPALKLDFEYVGKAIEKEGTHVWGSSPVRGRDGKIHMYVAEWPMPTNKEERFTGWYHHSRVAHYVGDSPEGPFEFVRIAVEDKDGDFNAPHNPTIQYLDGKYVLCFIVNEDNDKPKQRIIMLVSDDLDDTWRPAEGAEEDGTILRAPTDSTFWNYTTCRGTSNPSLVKFRGKYMLYFKSVIPGEDYPENPHARNFGYGVALSDNLEGPYDMHSERVTAENLQLEDAYAFAYNDKMNMLSRDFRGTLGTNGGGLLWASDDGMNFTNETTIRAFEGLDEYVDKARLEQNFVYRGNKEGHLERPQILVEDGKPQYMFVATGINDSSNYGSCSHVFKLNIK